MTLSLGIGSPADLLDKVSRDLARLDSAVAAQDKQQLSDALYDFSVSITSVKDWLKAHPSSSYTPADVENLVSNSTALSSFRDIANANKHRFITRYKPTTEQTTISAVSTYTLGSLKELLGSPRPQFKAKVVRVDGARLEAAALAQTAVSEWRAFMTKHGI